MGLETVALIATIGSAAIGTMGAIQQGNAAKASADYNAQVQNNNAKISLQNATFAGQKGAAAAEAESMKTRAKVGAITANQGASGVDIGSGSSVDVRSSASEMGELSAINIRSNAAREAYGYQTDAAGDKAQAQLDKAEGRNAQTAGYMNAGKTILGAAGSAANSWGSQATGKSMNAGWIDWNDGGSTYSG